MPGSQHDNELNIELDAIQAIGKALARVDDPKTRRRILQWATEPFGELPAAPAAAPPRDDQPLDSLVRGFASDIRRLAVLRQSA